MTRAILFRQKRQGMFLNFPKKAAFEFFFCPALPGYLELYKYLPSLGVRGDVGRNSGRPRAEDREAAVCRAWARHLGFNL